MRQKRLEILQFANSQAKLFKYAAAFWPIAKHETDNSTATSNLVVLFNSSDADGVLVNIRNDNIEKQLAQPLR